MIYIEDFDTFVESVCEVFKISSRLLDPIMLYDLRQIYEAKIKDDRGGYDEGYDDGYDIGYDEGHDESYDEGYSEGYDEGAEDATAKAKNSFAVIIKQMQSNMSSSDWEAYFGTVEGLCEYETVADML